MKPQPHIEAMLARHGVAYPPSGVWIGDGWVPIVENALGRMIAAGWDRELRQVKEKFGRLCIYVGAKSDAVGEVIDAACAEAARTCEHCGDPGALRTLGGWYVTLCPPCELRERQARAKDGR